MFYSSWPCAWNKRHPRFKKSRTYLLYFKIVVSGPETYIIIWIEIMWRFYVYINSPHSNRLTLNNLSWKKENTQLLSISICIGNCVGILSWHRNPMSCQLSADLNFHKLVSWKLNVISAHLTPTLKLSINGFFKIWRI